MYSMIKLNKEIYSFIHKKKISIKTSLRNYIGITSQRQEINAVLDLLGKTKTK